MEDDKLREIASVFLKKHGHPRYAQMIEQKCAFYVIEALLKRYGKRELLRLYLQMSGDLKRGLLYWFPINDTTNKQLEEKLLEIDQEYHRIRKNWQWSHEPLPDSEVKAYFRKLGAVILTWLKEG